MKNSKGLIWIILAVLIAVVLLLYKFGPNSQKRYNWGPTLSHEGAEPYDLEAFKKILMFKYDGFEASPKNSFSKLIARENIDYFAVGSRLYFKNAELDTLHQFIKEGGRAFLGFNYISDTGLLKLGVPKEYLRTVEFNAEEIELRFLHPSLEVFNPLKIAFYKGVKQKQEKYWRFFENSNNIQKESIKELGSNPAYQNEDEGYSDVEEVDPFGEEIDSLEDSEKEDISKGVDIYMDNTFWYGNNALKNVTLANTTHDILLNRKGSVCFKKFSVGDGELFLMLNPVLLGNVYAGADSTQGLFAGILAHFNAENAMLDIEANNFKLGSFSVGKKSTPLSYMLSKTWFKIGIYGLLFLGVLFMIFQSFRKYHPTKLFLQPQNRSIEQVRDIATVLSAEKNIRTARDYYCLSFENWHQSQHLHYQYGKKVDDPSLKRCQILASKSVWEFKDLKEFAQLFNELIIKYGK